MTSRQPSPDIPANQSIADRQFRRWFFLALLLTLGYMAWHYRHGEDSYVTTHDCLDVLVPEFSTFAKSGLLMARGDAVFPRELGGIPRDCLTNKLYLPLWSYAVLSPFQAFLLNELFARIVAVTGMALLLRRYVTPDAPAWLSSGAAACFALLPFYPYGLCVAGQPLLFYAVLNLDAGNKPWGSLFLVGLFPFYSYLINVGFFLMPLLAAYTVYRWWRGGRHNGWLAAATVLLAGGFVATNYRLILHWTPGTGYVSHRTEFAPPEQSLFASLRMARDNFLFGQYHAASCQFPVILLAAFLALAICLAKDAADDNIQWRRGWKGILGERNCSPAPVALVALFVACGVISLVYGLQDWEQTWRLMAATHLRILVAFNFGRVHWLHASLWGMIFALALEQIRTRVRSGQALAAALIVLQAVVAVRSAARETLTYREFYSPELFAAIRDYIGKPQESYRVGSIGMHPSIALYNGFYNIDG